MSEMEEGKHEKASAPCTDPGFFERYTFAGSASSAGGVP